MTSQPLSFLGLSLAAALGVAAACTSTLGRFEVEGSGGATSAGTGEGGATSASTSASGEAGVGGSGGGGGGSTSVIGYTCAWEQSKPLVLKSYDGAPGPSLLDVYVAERGTSGKARVLAVETAPGTSLQTLVALDPNPPFGVFAYPDVVEVLDVGRLSSVSTGVLAVLGGAMGHRLVMLELPDAESKFIEHALLLPANWAPQVSNPRYSGRFTPTDLLSPMWSVDVVVAFNDTSDTMNARYGNLTAKGGKTVSFVSPTLADFKDGMQVLSLFRVKSTSTSYAYVSPNVEGGGTQEFKLNGAVSGFVKPRPHGAFSLMLDAVARKDGVNASLVSFVGMPIEGFSLRVGRLPFDMLDKFEASDVPEVGSFKIPDEKFPAGDTFFAWMGDVMVFLGGTTLNADQGFDDVGFLMFDAAGHTVAIGKQPGIVATPPSGYTHRDFKDFAVGVPGGTLDGVDSNLHVAWGDVSRNGAMQHIDLGFSTLACKAAPLP